MNTPLLFGATACNLLALMFRFVFVGYGTVALLLFGIGLYLLAFAYLLGRQQKWARRLRIVLIAVLIIGFCCFMAAELPVLAGARADEDTSADYLIVMGAGVNGYEPSLSLLNRLEAAYGWLQENPNGIAILSGGLGDGEWISEAQCMYIWLTEKGISPERLIPEDQAASSYENIAFSLELLEAHGGDPSGRIAIVSNEYHLFRTRLIARHFGAEPVCVAARTPYPILFLNYAVREAFALWEIWVFGIN